MLITSNKVKWILTLRVLLGFMSVTAFLSMWISNTATTAMMVPIGQQVIVELIKYGRSLKPPKGAEVELQLIDRHSKTEDQTQDGNSKVEERKSSEKSTEEPELNIKNMSDSEKNIAKAIMICICFASNIGGTGTLTGTAPNIVMLGQVNDNLYNGKPTALNFATWMAFATPPMIACLIGCWACLVLYFLGWR